MKQLIYKIKFVPIYLISSFNERSSTLLIKKL